MKFFRVVTPLSVIGLVSLWSLASGFLSADPTDDLSLYLSQAPARDVYRLMSEKKVSLVLADRLDLFPSSLTPKLAHHLLQLCQFYRFDPAFILSLIQVESGFHIKIVSSVGAIGLMQVMPATAQVMIDDWDLPAPRNGTSVERALTDPFFNLTMGVAYLSTLRERYLGRSPYFLLAAYNVGPSRMDELLAKKEFRPNQTVKYYDAIRKGIPGFRYYRHPSRDLSADLSTKLFSKLPNNSPKRRLKVSSLRRKKIRLNVLAEVASHL
jgi:soluble lytic murein transglycosylase-like protein